MFGCGRNTAPTSFENSSGIEADKVARPSVAFAFAPQAEPLGTTEKLGATEKENAGWPNLFGPRRNGVSNEPQVNPHWQEAGPQVLWQREIGAGYSAPVVVVEHLIVAHRMAEEEIIECFDPVSGESRWEFRYPTSYACEYRYSSGPYSTPVIDEGHAYAIGAQGQIHCLRISNGQMVWRRDLDDEFGWQPQLFAFGSSPLISDGRLIINAGGKKGQGIIALDKHSGATLWSATDQKASYASPVAARIHGREFVFVVTFAGLVALDPSDGRVRWTIEHRPKSPDTVNATSPLVVGDLVLQVSGPGPGALCVQVLPDGSYEKRWHDRRVLDSQFNTLVSHNEHVFGFSSRRQGGATFRCVELATGRLCWEWKSPLDRGQALACGKHLILLGEFGHLGSLQIDVRKPLPISMTAEPLLSAPCYSAPALFQDMLYLRNESQLICLDLRPTSARPAAAARLR